MGVSGAITLTAGTPVGAAHTGGGAPALTPDAAKNALNNRLMRRKAGDPPWR